MQSFSDTSVERYLEPSDEEVLGYDDESEDDVADQDPNSTDEDRSESEVEGGVQDWGTSKADYYDADVIETEADALEEEAEARRLQQMQLQNMTEADFGFDEEEWAQVDDKKDPGQGTTVEKLPDVVVTEDTPVVERLKILKSKYPELEPLAQEYAALQDTLDELKVAASVDSVSTAQPSRRRKAGQDKNTASISASVLKWRALSAYMGSIAMYFALLTAPASGKSGPTAPMLPGAVRQHPIMQSLLRSKQSWDTVRNLPNPETQADEVETDVSSHEMPSKTQPKVSTQLPQAALILPALEKKVKKSKQLKDDTATSLKKSKRARKEREAGGVLDELDSLIASVKHSSTTRAPALLSKEDDSDFGDEVALTAQEAAEKAQRKKGLRFYTSQLAQKHNKRDAASRDAGGDADLPYKERLKDRQARLMREAAKRGGEEAQLEQRLDYQDDDEDEEDTARVAREVRDDADNSDDYYQTISSKSKAKKADKAARAAVHTEAAKVGGQVYAEEVVGDDGKRGITYEIAKNKGLMPRRKKEVRNPRVKKRMKYDEKLKKLGSIRQVYKGGEGKGGYGGELSGIKTNVVRSVKL